MPHCLICVTYIFHRHTKTTGLITFIFIVELVCTLFLHEDKIWLQGLWKTKSSWFQFKRNLIIQKVALCMIMYDNMWVITYYLLIPNHITMRHDRSNQLNLL